MAMKGIAYVGTVSTHGGMVISGSSDSFVCGKQIARFGDMHSCPIPGHGVTPIVIASDNMFVNGKGVARQQDMAACGAILVTVCDSVLA